MKPRNFWNLEQVPNIQEKWTQATAFLKDVYGILNNGITFKDNFRSVIIDHNFTTANVEVTIKHGLAFTPSYYIVVKAFGSSISLYNTKEFDEKNVYLKATAIGTVSILIF